MEFNYVMTLPFIGYIGCFAGDKNTELLFEKPCKFKVIESGQVYLRVEGVDEYSQSVLAQKFCECCYIPVSVVVQEIMFQLLYEVQQLRGGQNV